MSPVAPAEAMQSWRDKNRERYNAYMRERRLKINNGTWNPHRHKDNGKERLTRFELGWAVGILEGEGNFSPAGYSLRARVSTTDEWVADKLLDLFGGAIGFQPRTNGCKDVHVWSVNGDRAIRVFDLTFEHLSPRRQDQILLAFEKTGKV